MVDDGKAINQGLGLIARDAIGGGSHDLSFSQLGPTMAQRHYINPGPWARIGADAMPSGIRPLKADLGGVLSGRPISEHEGERAHDAIVVLRKERLEPLGNAHQGIEPGRPKKVQYAIRRPQAAP